MLKAPSEQGTLEGFIYEVSGNQMPMRDKPVNRHGKGISREIWIYATTTAAQAQGSIPLFTKINSRYVAQTNSDSTGRYQIHLPAGNYSIFIKEDSGFFAAETDGQGYLNAVNIQNNAVVTKNVIVNLKAAY